MNKAEKYIFSNYKSNYKKILLYIFFFNSAIVYCTQPLIIDLNKQTIPIAPGFLENGIAEVGATDSVPVEFKFFGENISEPSGISIVFLIDNSRSMEYMDSNKDRFRAIRTLVNNYSTARNNLDKIAIVLFSGSRSTLVQNWTTWEGTGNTLDSIENNEPEGMTPMADGIEHANNLLMEETGLYRMCILLSDGYPEPDNEEYPQTESIMEELLPKARNNRILYSTIYLCKPESPDNALLIDIARATDYINDNSIADFPKYYFRIEESGNMISAYEGLFSELINRTVPQNVTFKETISPRIFVDSNYPVTFSGSGFTEARNILDEPLTETYNHFINNNTFKVRMNELDGQAILKFNVKLDIETITDQELEDGYVLIDINDLQNSMISYINMVNTNSQTIKISTLPQATIRFNLGLRVRKNITNSGKKINIGITNLEPNDVSWIEIAEFPNSYLNIKNVNHNFDFNPMDLIYKKYIIPWMYNEVIDNLSSHPSSYIENRIRRESIDVLKEAHKSVLNIDNRINKNLQKFGFSSIPHNAFDPYWFSKYQHGVYLLERKLPGKQTISMIIDVENAAELNNDSSIVSISNGADATDMKGIEVLSKYRSEAMNSWELVSPNPLISQIVQYDPKPDMYVETCFSESDIEVLSSFYKGSRSVDPWELLDSPDIKCFISHRNISSEQGRFGVSVNVHNIGLLKGSCTVSVNSFFIPITGNEGISPFIPMSSFYSSGIGNIEAIESFSSEEVTIWLDDFFFIDGQERIPLTKEEYQEIKKAIVISIVKVESEHEFFSGNNEAIEISRVYFKRF